ncbi:MAG: mannitol dehydrogenase family protein, partial [Pseudomonadota bacterium]
MLKDSSADYPRLSRQGDAPRPGIVHFGPGAFFRAFNAPFTNDAMVQQGVDDWGIVAVSLKSASTRDNLMPQGCAYTAIELAPTGPKARQISAISKVLVAVENPAAVVDLLADPAIKIASLTVTEKGYCHNPSTGGLDQAHPDIEHDLADLKKPRSALGFLVAALQRRHLSGSAPFTVLSCDNLPSNGRLLRGLVLQFAAVIDVEFAQWIEEQVPFPCTMVDRITPATTDDDIADLAVSEGYYDPACVVHEPFRQWVIENRFADGRPAWEQVGAQIVEDVEAHELMKLRCLNGTHSTLAYLGYLAGYQTIADTVADPVFSRLCEKLWSEEILPTIPQPQGENLEAYCQALLERYRNPAIHHRTWQIAMDGSQKLPQRLLGTIKDSLDAGKQPHGLCLAVAGWIKYVGGLDEQGQVIDVRDPMAMVLKDRLEKASDPEGKV